MLTERELRWALYCAAEEKRAREAGKQPGVQPWNADLVRRLELEIAVSRSRHESCCGGEQYDAWISARQAAAELGMSKRQTERLHADLDAQLIDERFWIFPAGVVTEYARERRSDDHPRRREIPGRPVA